MTKQAKKIANGKTKLTDGRIMPAPPPGMLVTRSGRLIAKPALKGTIPIAKIRAAVARLPRARKD